MYISGIDANSKIASKTAFIYLLVALFCVFFGVVYELFSHQVYSFYMIYAFVFPLVGGTLPFFILSLKQIKIYPSILARNFYHSSIATFTMGSIVQGVLNIYGTTNVLSRYYWIIGIVFSITGVVIYLRQLYWKNG